LKEKPVADIARDFQDTRQRVYQLITAFKEIGEYPELKPLGRSSQPIAPGIEELILESCRTNKPVSYPSGEEDRRNTWDSHPA
jgi:hypothetical protein